MDGEQQITVAESRYIIAMSAHHIAQVISANFPEMLPFVWGTVGDVSRVCQ